MSILENISIIEVSHKQYPVGQGGLHLSVIESFGLDNRLIIREAYIYDCGDSTHASENSPITLQINNLFNDISPYLDKLYIFISHLHQDHYNGLFYLKDLIQQTPILKTKPRLMLPYMTETEMDIQIKAYDENNVLSKSDYEKFIRNPEDFFENIFEVIYIKDNDDFGENGSVKKNNPKQNCPNGSNSDNGLKILLDDKDRKFIIHNQEIHIGNPGHYWVLKPFYNPISAEDLNDIRNEVDCDSDNISPEQMKKNKKCYQQKFKDLNLSSVCLYSGPNYNIKSGGFMHTGDAKLLKRDVYNNFKKHYTYYLGNVCVVQIPHHGSEKDSNYSTFNIFPNFETLYVTKQEKTNGTTYPHLSSEYTDRDNVKKITEQPDTVFTPIPFAFPQKNPQKPRARIFQ